MKDTIEVEEEQKPEQKMTPMQVILDSGGVRGIAMKFVMYFLLPLAVLIGLGYFGYDLFQKRKFHVEPGKTGNESKPHVDKPAAVQIIVEQLKPSVQEDSDVETFRRVDEKIRKTYGL